MKPEAYDANEVVGAKREKQHEGKTNTIEEWEGRSSPKAAQHWGPFHITAAVDVNQAVSINNFRPEQAGLMSFSLCPTPTTSTSQTPHLPQAPGDHMNLTSDSSPSCNLPICTHVKKPNQSELCSQSGDRLKEVHEICNTGEDNGNDGGNSRMK